MTTTPTPATPPPPGSMRDLFRAMQERNAPRRTEVHRHVESLRQIAARLRAASR
jgi:hypothetical protein